MVSASTTNGTGSTGVVTIGDWLADPQTNTLRRGGASVRLEPKAMDVLMVLAQHAGSVVTRAELFAAAWPGLVVGDEALSQSIIKLRRALGDQPRAPTYIETVAKRGYRLIASVAPIDRHPTEPPPPATDMPPPPAPVPSWHAGRTVRPFGAAALALGAAAVAAIGAIDLLAPSPALQAVDATDSTDVRQAPWVTVTIVPFESLGLDAQYDHVPRGISETLATDLARLSGLRVIQPSADRPGVAARDAARYRITGSVQRVVGAIRINVRVMDTSTLEQVWAGRLERPAGDVLAAQDALATALVDVLPAKVNEIERQRLAKRHTSSAEAYDEFLRAQALFLARRSDANVLARELYRAAVERDPQFARAYAGLAMTYALDDRLQGSPADPNNLERAFALANTARAIDPDLPEPYWALGFVHAQGRDHERAIVALKRAIELNASYADAYALLGGIETYVGRPAASIPLLRTAMRLNPDAGYLYFLLLGRAYLFANDVEQSLINLRAAASRNPADVEARVYLAAALAANGDRAAARWEADEIRTLQPGFSTARWLATYPATSDEHMARLRGWLASAGL